MSDNTALPKIDQQGLKVATPLARTTVDATSAYAGAFGADIAVGSPDGSLTITAKAIRSEAAASCSAGLQGSSQVVGLAVNGTAIPVDQALTQISTLVDGTPLNLLVRLYVNRQTREGDTLTQQAVVVELLGLGGKAPIVIVLGEAKITAPPAGCNADGGNGGGGSGGGGNGGGGSGGGGNGGGSGNGNVGGVGTVLLNGRNGGCGRLRMWFVPNRGRAYTTRFSTRVVTRGLLRACNGKAITGARVDVYHLLNGRKVRLQKTGMKSRDKGRLTLILPMGLTNRRLIFEYRGDLASRKVTSRMTLQLKVRRKRR